MVATIFLWFPYRSQIYRIRIAKRGLHYGYYDSKNTSAIFSALMLQPLSAILLLTSKYVDQDIILNEHKKTLVSNFTDWTIQPTSKIKRELKNNEIKVPGESTREDLEQLAKIYLNNKGEK